MAEGSGIYPPNSTDEVILVTGNFNNFVREKFSLILNMFDVFAYSSKQCCESGMFILDPRSEFFYPGSAGSKVKKIPNPNLHQRS
jgi:hypothetical protein